MKKLFVSICFTITAFLGFAGCKILFPAQMPDKTDLIRILEEERFSFEAISDYLNALDYESCFIDSDNGEYFADFERHAVDDAAVVDAIKCLWKKGCSHISKDTEKNSIVFELRHNDQETACGVLNRIDDREKGEAEFMTYIEKTDLQNWYFYISDYNEYRTKNN